MEKSQVLYLKLYLVQYVHVILKSETVDKQSTLQLLKKHGVF